jgi:hypothetical protein
LDGLLVVLLGIFPDARASGDGMPMVGAEVAGTGSPPIDTGDLDGFCRVGSMDGGLEGWIVTVPSGEIIVVVVLRVNSLMAGTSSNTIMTTRAPIIPDIRKNDKQRLRLLDREFRLGGAPNT